MKYLMIIASLVASSVSAQDMSSVYFLTKQPCAPANVILDSAKSFEEELLFVMNGVITHISDTTYTSGMGFLVNQTSGTWTLMSIYEDGMGCMIASGTDFEPYSGPTDDEVK